MQLYSKTLQSLIQLEYHGSTKDLRKEFLNHRLVIVSDGSYKKDTGAGAWIITSELTYPNVLSSD